MELLIFIGIGWLILATLKSNKNKQNANRVKQIDPEDIGVTMTVTIGTNNYSTDNMPVLTKNVNWIAPGENVTVAGYNINGGCIYVGNSMSADIDPISALKSAAYLGVKSSSYSGNWMAQRTIDPSLINPNLPVASRNPDSAGTKMDYWPSYSTIDPTCRLAYLQWLSGGKNDPSISIGYVFLYFYGLERRILGDMPVREEMLMLISEIERLRNIYSNNRSFDSYSTRLLEVANFILRMRNNPSLETIKPEIEESSEANRAIQLVALASKIKDGSLLPFEWAMIGYFYAVGWHQRIASTRVRSVFLALMKKRFESKWPQGLKLRHQKSQFTYYYNGANQYLRFDLAPIFGLQTLPDPQVYDWSKLVEMASKAEDDLAAYARAVGRNPELAGSAKAIPLLPSEIAGEQINKLAAPLESALAGQNGAMKRINMSDLVQKITGETSESLELRSLRNIAEVVAHLGYGMEPDPSFGRLKPKINDICIIFDAKDFKNPRAAVSDTYSLASSIAILIAGVAGTSTDGIGNAEKWVMWIRKTLNLGDYESRRLHAFLTWLSDQKPTLTQVKRALAEVPEQQRGVIAYLAAAVAAADGVIEKSEVAFLEKVYDELGVERSKLYGTLHELAATSAKPATEPVTIEKSTKSATGFKIQSLPDLQTKTKNNKLDTSRISKIIEETHQVSSVLASIFANEDEHASTALSSSNSSVGTNHRFAGLDRANATLVERLMTQHKWEHSAFVKIAKELGLMPDGALEAINEWSFENFEEALIEDGDPIEINRDLIDEIENMEIRSKAA